MTQLISINREFDSNLIDLIEEGKNGEFEVKLRAKLLLRHASGPQDLVDNTGSTLLHYAVKFHNIGIISHLVRLGYKNSAFNNEGHTPLMLAVANNCTSSVEILFKRISDTHFRKLLEVMFSTKNVCPEIVKLVFRKLKKADDKTVAKLLLETKCLLYNAIFLDRVRMVKIMIDNGCSVNVKNPFDGHSPLHVAVACRNLNLVRLLVKHGADVNAVNHKGEIPLNSEQKYSSKELEILKILVEEGSLLSSCDNSGRMQMFKIVRYHSSEALKIILRSNIDLNAQDQHGDTVIHYCAQNDSSNMIFPLFVKYDFNPNIRNRSGHTPLHILSVNVQYLDNFYAIQLLLAKGADVNIKAYGNGISSLHNLMIECQYQHVEMDCMIRDIIVEYGADVQYVTNNGETILDEIDKPGSSDIVLSYFALLEAQGTTIVDPIRRKIDCTDWIKSRIKSYSSKLERLKIIEIYESVTMFKLLTCSKIKFRSYLRNKQLAIKLRRVLAYNAEGVDRMYIEFLKIRVNTTSNIIAWQQKAEVAFCKLVDSSVRFPDLIINEVMGYLSLQDMKILAAVKCPSKNTSKRERPDSDENVCKRKC